MISIWRLVRKKHIAAAFDGEGARIYGGRWNAPGTGVVYTAQNLSLAVLEQFVHLGREDTHLQFTYFRVDIPGNVKVDELDPKKLPPDWRTYPAPVSTQTIGTEWVNSSRGPVLKIPSVIIPDEYTYLLNPSHPDFRKLRILGPEPFSLDPRMWK